MLAIRPYSLGNAVIPVAVGSALAHAAGRFAPLPALGCLLFAVLLQITANFVNDLCDTLKGADREDRLGPDRACAKGLITPRNMKRGIAAATLAAALAGCGVLTLALRSGVLRYGGAELVAAGALCILFAYLYTAGPRPLAYLGLGDLAVLLFFGIVPVGLTCYVQCGTWPATATLAGAACGLTIDTMLWINNFRDREADAESGKRTLIVRFGERFGRIGYLLLGAAAFGCTLLLSAGGRPWTLLTAPVLLLHLATWRKMVRIGRGRELNRCLGETARNILLFGLLLTIGLLLGTA